MSKKHINGIEYDLTPEEQAEYDARQAAWEAKSAERKLILIKEMRLERLEKTDYLANSDVVMTDEMKTYRQGMRDIPQNNSTEEEYDLILARVDGNLTHAIWNKP
jgi:hypothetical protein